MQNHLFSKEYNFLWYRHSDCYQFSKVSSIFHLQQHFILYFTYFGFQYICYHIGADIFINETFAELILKLVWRVPTYIFSSLCFVFQPMLQQCTYQPRMVSTIVPIRPCRVYLGAWAGRLLEYQNNNNSVPGYQTGNYFLNYSGLTSLGIFGQECQYPHYRKATQHPQVKALRQLRCWKRRCYRDWNWYNCGWVYCSTNSETTIRKCG